MFHTRGVCSIYWNEETIILSDSGNTASPTLLDPDKFQKEIGKGAMGCLTAHIDERCGCDHLDTILGKIGYMKCFDFLVSSGYVVSAHNY